MCTKELCHQPWRGRLSPCFNQETSGPCLNGTMAFGQGFAGVDVNLEKLGLGLGQ